MNDFRYPLTTPPEGAITVAVARHQSSTIYDPMFAAYVQDRHDLVYDLVEHHAIKVVSSGPGDHLGPGNEVWELVFGGIGAATALIGAIPVLIGWVGDARRKPTGGKPTVRSVRMKRPDGVEFEFGLSTDLTLEETVEKLQGFLGPIADAEPPSADEL